MRQNLRQLPEEPNEMKRHLIAVAVIAAIAAPLFAQESASDKVVATINGESVTKSELDQLWARIGEKMQQQYEKNGRGKLGFLENYIGKKLIIQKAISEGFGGNKPGTKLDADAEAALFNRYVREVIAKDIVQDAEVRDFYDKNPNEFTHPEQAKVHLIHISATKRPESDAYQIASGLLQELFAYRTNPEQMKAAFAAAARRYSEHPSAQKSGDLGWVNRGALEKDLDHAAFTIAPHTLSGIIKEHGELHLMIVDERRPAGKETFEEARGSIHDYLLAKNAPKVMQALNLTTAELRSQGKVTMNAENLK